MKLVGDTEGAMLRYLENVVDLLVGARVPLHVEYDFMRNEYVVTWEPWLRACVCVDRAMVDDARFGQRDFDSREEMDRAAMNQRVIADRVARTIIGAS